MTQSDIGIVEKLLPCPFCGANEEGFKRGLTGAPKLEELSEGGWRVTCYTCRYSISWEPNPTAARAVLVWNTRDPIITEMVEALEQLRGNAEIAKRYLPNTVEGDLISSALFDTISQADTLLAKVRGK